MSNKATQFNSETGSEAGKKGGAKSKRKSWTKMRELAEEEIKELIGDKDPDVLAVTALVKLVQEGDLRAIQEWLDRNLGKATQVTEEIGDKKNNITVTFVEPDGSTEQT